MHVLESDQVAEHIPGCNMAFRREALLAINGFDSQFTKAGDDVDICWRLQQSGGWITFAAGAFVWHHRRQTPRTYFRQQMGYGDAEALLRFKHPERFNGQGHGKWRGVLYGPSLQGLVLDEAIIYRGTYGTGFFQCIYQPGPAHWAMLPATLEWQILAATVALLGFCWWPLAVAGGVMMLMSLGVAVGQAWQARIARAHDGLRSRLLIAALCWAQPIVRTWARYRTRYYGHYAPLADTPEPLFDLQRWRRKAAVSYWGADAPERVELLRQVVGQLESHRFGKTVDTGWTEGDLEVFTDPWTVVQLKTAQEEHGSGKRVIRIGIWLRLNKIAKALLTMWLTVVLLIALSSLPLSLTLVGAMAMWAAVVWSRGARLAAKVLEICDQAAKAMQLVPCTHAEPAPERPPAVVEVPV
jgi:hypothetical protein